MGLARSTRSALFGAETGCFLAVGLFGYLGHYGLLVGFLVLGVGAAALSTLQ